MSSKTTQQLLDQKNSNDECHVVKIGDKRYKACDQYATQQTEFFNHLTSVLNKEKKPTIEWSAHCKNPKSKETVPVSDAVANNIYLINTYGKEQYKTLSIQDMICLLDHYYRSENNINKTDIPNGQHFVLCLQSIVITNIENLNMLFILVGSFQTELLKWTTSQHLLLLLLNGIKTASSIKENWWEVILFVDYYFYNSIPEDGDLRKQQTIIKMIETQKDPHEWKNQMLANVAQSIGYYYGSTDVITIQHMLTCLFVQSCNKKNMKVLFDDWIARMDNRMNYALRNMVICFFVRSCSMVVIQLDPTGTITNQFADNNALKESYSCSRVNDEWRVTYTNPKSVQITETDNTFLFLQFTPWKRMSAVGVINAVDEQGKMTHIMSGTFNAQIDLDAIRVYCALNNLTEQIMQMFYHLPMNKIVSVGESNEKDYRLPFTDKQLKDMFSKIVLNQ
jgi:hypothetical protein